MVETDHSPERDNITIKYKTRIIQIKITKEIQVIDMIQIITNIEITHVIKKLI